MTLEEQLRCHTQLCLQFLEHGADCHTTTYDGIPCRIVLQERLPAECMAMIQHYFKLPVDTFTLPSVPLVQVLGKKPTRWKRWGLREKLRKLRRFSVKENGVSRKGAEIQLGEGVPEELVPLSSG